MEMTVTNEALWAIASCSRLYPRPHLHVQNTTIWVPYTSRCSV